MTTDALLRQRKEIREPCNMVDPVMSLVAFEMSKMLEHVRNENINDLPDVCFIFFSRD